MKITADFKKITGRIKPMHGVGQPPVLGANNSMMHYIGEAGIPYSRLHDTGGAYGGNMFVDIPNLFRDFDADENLPESYDFTFTDYLLNELKKQGCEPFFRLGVTIENYQRMKAYRIFPPKDYEKWASVCEHVVAHYNEGWADGYHMGITYWEIWNEPDNHIPGEDNAMWRGTADDYFRLYEVTSKRLKKRFGDAIKVGGFASCGFYGMENDPEGGGLPGPATERKDYFIEFFHKFLDYVKAHEVPLDFFSWHTYADVRTALAHEDYCRKVLEKHGFGDVPDILNEWNNCHEIGRRGTPYAAANCFAMMLAMQKKPISMLNYYDARIGHSQYGGLFNPDSWKPYLTYFTFMSFNEAYKLENEVETSSDDGNVYVCGAEKDGKAVLLLVNIGSSPVTVEFDVKGADVGKAEILLINDVYSYSPCGKKVRDGKLTLGGNTCAELRL